jgi:hypothetical protein
MPHTHVWTRKQKWLIVTSVVITLLALASGIYTYERYYRGPGDEVFYGTWEASDYFLDGESAVFQFRSDQTFSQGGVYDGEFIPYFGGKWYAGGTNFYLRFSADDMERPQQVIVLRIVEIGPNEFRLTSPFYREPRPNTFRRIVTRQPTASNQAMERTAVR